MDISGISSNLTASLAAKTNDAVGIAVLKKAIDLQASTAAGLVQALPQPSNPNIGRNINTTA
jgi:hypothetical protein